MHCRASARNVGHSAKSWPVGFAAGKSRFRPNSALKMPADAPLSLGQVVTHSTPDGQMIIKNPLRLFRREPLKAFGRGSKNAAGAIRL